MRPCAAVYSSNAFLAVNIPASSHNSAAFSSVVEKRALIDRSRVTYSVASVLVSINTFLATRSGNPTPGLRHPESPY